MSNNDYSPLSDPNVRPLTMSVPQTVPAEQANGNWLGPASFVPMSQQASHDFTVYAHALRRHWVVAVGLGVLLAALIGPAVWLTYGARYTANSYLRVATQEPVMVFPTEQVRVQTEFEIYKATQQQLIKSRFVLTAALRDPSVTNLACVQAEEDPVSWLARELRVNYPGKAEIMEVALTGTDPKEVTALVRAVVDAYMDEVVDVERNQRRQQLSELDRVYTDKETEVRQKRTDLRQLAEQLGTSETDVLSLKQQNALQELAAFRSELMKTQFLLMRRKGELKALQAELEGIDKLEVSDIELAAAAYGDPVARRLLDELAFRQQDMSYTEYAVREGVQSQLVDRMRREVSVVQQQYDSRANELREELKRRQRMEIEKSLREAELQTELFEAEEAQLAEEVRVKREEAFKYGGSSIDVEMMRAEIEHLDNVLEGIANEREKVKVELRSASRVRLLQRADEPEVSDRTMRVALTMLALMMGLVLPGVCIALWDSRAQRVNSARDVSNGLGLPVIGSVPVIPSHAIRQLGSPSKRHMNWHTRLTEAADSIAARLLRKAQLEQTRVVLITSAMGGEGKTTLATQVAMSLARSEHSAVLVDFDLRRPAFDEIFGLPLKPGVSEFLRGEVELDDAVQKTITDDLSVMTAGRWDRQALTALANGAAGDLFEKLRERFDFVLVDASPILPVADTRFVSQHVDAVVLSVLRDVSQAPRISAACEILRGFGVRVIEAVVTGPSDSGRYKDLGYEPRLPA